MFDPTAFDNLKVIVEGAIYDRDLEGEVLVIDRKDLVNLANMSRDFRMSFRMKNEQRNSIYAELQLKADLENLAAELLEHNQQQNLSGCIVSVDFVLRHRHDEKIYKDIKTKLEEIWGVERSIEQVIQVNPLKTDPQINNRVSIQFNRLVFEDQVDDLVEMLNYIVLSLQELTPLITK